MPGNILSSGSPEYILKFANAISKVGDTLAGKLYEAEIANQVITGQQRLTTTMNQFDFKLDSDPEWKTYQERNLQAQDDAWDQVAPEITNPVAYNKLSEWWAEHKGVRERQVNDKTTDRRINEMQGDYESNRSLIISGAGDIETKKKALRELSYTYTSTGVVSGKRAQLDLNTDIYKVNMIDLESRVNAIAYAPDASPETAIDDALNYAADSANSPELTDEDRHRVITTFYENYAHTRALLADQQERDLGKIRDDGYLGIMAGTWTEANINAIPYHGPRTEETRNTLRLLLKSRDEELLKEASRTAKPFTNDEEDEFLREYYLEFTKGTFANTLAARNDLIDRASKTVVGNNISIGALVRFTRFVKEEIPSEVTNAVNSVTFVPAGSTPEEKKIYEDADLKAKQYLKLHPEINTPAAMQEIAQDFLDAKKNKFISEKIDTFLTGKKPLPSIGNWLAGLFGNDDARQNLEVVKMIQEGTLARLAEAGDKDAVARIEEYTSNASEFYKQVTKDTASPGMNPNPPIRKAGRFAGQRPLMQILSTDRQTLYELWFSPDNGVNWYSIPTKTYTTGFTDKDWILVKPK